jgi:hypothetical protein
MPGQSSQAFGSLSDSRWALKLAIQCFAPRVCQLSLARFTDATKLALELGHPDQELIFRHYRELVKPDQAAKYWSLRPATQTNLLAISASVSSGCAFC